MNKGDRVIATLGNLRLGGTIVMIVTYADYLTKQPVLEYTVETLSGSIIVTRNVIPL